jgi:hypothetical protein
MHCAVVIAVDRAESVISPAYDDGMTEPEVRARWQKHFAEIEDGIMGYKPGHDLGYT